MSAVIAVPELIVEAATDLATIGETVSAAHMTAAAPTAAVLPAAADEVSAGIAHLFSQHAQDYQALAGQAAAFHGQFVQNLTASAASYTSTEDAIASLLNGFSAWIDPLLFWLSEIPYILSNFPEFLTYAFLQSILGAIILPVLALGVVIGLIGALFGGSLA
jgi:hypothetical protein